MKIKFAKITCFLIVAAALAAAPSITRAADSTNAPAADSAAPKKHGALPFHGKVAALDPAAMTFTVGTLTIAISSATRITNEGKPAIFSDLTVGVSVSGSYKKDAEGKLNASSVKIGGAKKKTAAAAPDAPVAK